MNLTDNQKTILRTFDGMGRDTMRGENMFKPSRRADVAALSEMGYVTYHEAHRTLFVAITKKGSDFIYEGGIDS